MRSREPAAATAAPAGSRPTSSEPRTVEPARRRLALDRGDDLVRRRGLASPRC